MSEIPVGLTLSELTVPGFEELRREARGQKKNFIHFYKTKLRLSLKICVKILSLQIDVCILHLRKGYKSYNLFKLKKCAKESNKYENN